MMKNTLRLDHAKKLVIMDKTFAKFAANTHSEEYAHLQQVRRDDPHYTWFLATLYRLVALRSHFSSFQLTGTE